jgi:hypothetical protein
MTAITKTIPDPALGERALAVHPPLAPGGDTADFDAQGWGRHTRYVAGRSVTDRALQTDQRHAEGHIATAGQRLAPGVVVGLEVTVEGTRAEPILHIAPGIGVCLNGEDVRVMHPVEIPAARLRVAGGDGAKRLSDVLAEGGGLTNARAFIIQLRPVVVERTGVDDADDPCEVDPEAIAFTDEQLIDGCRVRLFPVTPPNGVASAKFRNEVAYQIFQLEAAQGLEQVEWQAGGLPIAVLGFPPGVEAAYVDIHAAARRGGHANPRQPRVQSIGTHALWQARFEQFVAQIADSNIEALKTDGLATRFHFLPPVGMLPPGAIDVRGDIGEPDFPLPHPTILPEEFVIEAVPVEIEALDDYLRASVSLAPFDTAHQEQVQVLVPVPQQHFDPDLLIVEDETPDEFRDAIERFLLVLNHRLGRRFFLRAAERHLVRTLHGNDLVAPDEPTAVVGEVGAFFPIDQVVVDAGLPVPDAETLVGAEVTPRIIALVTQMYNAVGGPTNQISSINPLAASLRAAALHYGAAAPEADNIDQSTPDQLVDVFVYYRFGGHGLVGFTNFCVRQLVLASERITLAFERMQAELYRIRQYISGTQAANQLASSPVISAIAVRDPSAQAPLQLSAFATALRKAKLAAVVPQNLPERIVATVPTKGIATGGRAIASSVLFKRNLLERLESSPPSFDASANADRATREALRTILHINDDLGLSLEGMVFPERLFNRNNTTPPIPEGAPVTLQVVRTEIRRWLDLGEWEHEFDDAAPGNEADFFGNAVRRLEEMVAVLRIAEARLTAYEAVVDLMRDEIGALQQSEKLITGRLAQLQDEIEELRHDVQVARALEREEMARAVRVNQRRAQVIAEHVPFLVFRRPRSIEAVRVPPSVPLATASDPDIVPDCLDDQIVPPEQLSAMLHLIRDIPVNRLKIGPAVVKKIDRHPQLLALAEFVLHTTVTPPPFFYDPFAGELFSDRTGVALRARYFAHRELINRLRIARGQLLSTTAYRSHSWSRLQAFVQDTATIANVLMAPHVDQRWVQPLAKELDNFSRVAACLYEQFKAVPPLLRLDWVRQVSEEDEVVPRLDDLSKLPSWEKLDRIQRRDLQSLIDWLFGRFDRAHDDGIAYVSDLVRVALLLSGHAPVQRVLDAVVVAPHPVSLGGIVRLQIDPARVRVGMHVALFADAARTMTVAAGIVDDLAEGVVAVRLVSTTGGAVRPTHALVSDPTMGPKVQLSGGRQQSIGFASKLS